MATPVDVSLCVSAYTSTDASATAAGWSPVGLEMTIGSPRCGAAAQASANFDENSPNTRCWLRDSTRPNVATSQNTVVPPLPSTISQPSGRPNSSRRPARTRAHDLLDRRLAVGRPEHRPAGGDEGVELLGPDLGGPASEAAVGGQELGGQHRRGGVQPGGGAGGHCDSMSAGHSRSPHRTERVRRVTCLRTPRRHRRVGHAGRRRQGQGTAGPGRERDRLRGRRTRLPDAGAHRRGGRRRLPGPEEPPLHAGRRPPRAEGGDRPQDQARQRLRRRRVAGPGHQRRQARRVHGLRRALRSRRRGHLPGAVLDHLPGGDRPRRRSAEDHRHHGGDRLPGHRRAARGGLHAPHEGAPLRQPRQPVGRGVPARAGGGDRPLGGRARRLGDHRRDLRAPDVRSPRVRLDADAGAGRGRPVHRRERRRQDVRHDRAGGSGG